MVLGKEECYAYTMVYEVGLDWSVRVNPNPLKL